MANSDHGLSSYQEGQYRHHNNDKHLLDRLLDEILLRYNLWSVSEGEGWMEAVRRELLGARQDCGSDHGGHQHPDSAQLTAGGFLK